jgi:hypothetical protein
MPFAMRADRAGRLARSGVDQLQSSPRRVWWASFVLVALLGGLWAVANPPFAAPDEPAHVERAVALAHGELTGKTPSRQDTRRLHLTDRKDYLVVRVPALYGHASRSACFPRNASATAACLEFNGSTRDTDTGTYVARHPPSYYALVGTASWLVSPGDATVYVMRLIGVLIAAVFLATAVSALRRAAAPRLLAMGVALAITPMVLFVSSAVNPSGPEIASAIAFWVCGLLLISTARERVDTWLVTAVGVAGCVLALSRQLGPLWIGLISLVLLRMANRAALGNLWRSIRARVWAGLVAASCVLQGGWDTVVKPLEVTRSGHEHAHPDVAEVLRITIGRTFPRYREMIGWFGWLDTPAPALTWVPWTILLAVLVLAAALWVTRRHLAVLLALAGATILVPIVIESATFSDAGTLTWQGRYTLPLAVGVPILAAAAVSTTERGRRLLTSRVLVAVAIIVSAGQFVAFAQNLRRYSVGYDGTLAFWHHAAWSPPAPAPFLTVAFAVVVIAFVWWLLEVVPRGAEAAAPDRQPDVAREQAIVMAPEG